MPYIEIDVPLDSFDTEDIVKEVCSRIISSSKGATRGRYAMTKEQKERIKKDFSHLAEILSLMPNELITINTLDDKMKYEHLCEVFKKYTTAEIEKILP